MKQSVLILALLLAATAIQAASTEWHPGLSYAARNRFKDMEELERQSLEADSLFVERRRARALFDSIPSMRKSPTPVNLIHAPRVLKQYRSVRKPGFRMYFPDEFIAQRVWSELAECAGIANHDRDLALILRQYAEVSGMPAHSVVPDSLMRYVTDADLPPRDSLTVAFGDITPAWLSEAMTAYSNQRDFIFTMMMENPANVEYAYWKLPVPPTLPEEDFSFRGLFSKYRPDVNVGDAVITEAEIEKVNWLHNFNISLQLSQAYISKNWYQGGNDYLAILGNFLWDVQLNTVYHPKMMFQSTLSYKLALNSQRDDLYHKYSVSQDLFQYNLKTGYKASHNWYYTFLAQFKTQMLNSYPANSMTRTAAFLSPGELNLGLGMTYTKETGKKNLKIGISISPLSYNLKTCIDSMVDETTLGIEEGHRIKNEIGSNSEVNLFWRIWDNITYTTRLFLFTDYKTFLGDWENTLNFQFNRFFSTQLYMHLRYDSGSDPAVAPRWNRWMMKEILSVGLSYTFSTKG